MAGAIDIRGLAETQKAIYQYSAKMGDKVVVSALRKGANHLRKAVKQAVPVKTGRLKAAIVVRGSKLNRRKKNGRVGLYLAIKKGKRDDKKTALYGAWVEHGYTRQGYKTVTKKIKGINKKVREKIPGKATHVEGKKFLSGAFAAQKEAVLDTVVAEIEAGGIKLARELGL